MTVQKIVLGIEDVDEIIRSMAMGDVIETLENGHPLNRLIADQEDKVHGFIACEDFVPNEAYIKYFGTDGQAGRNLFIEIPVFFEYAKHHGYTKLNFHGWNERMNRVLERFGFQKLRTDSMNGFSADFYEKVLVSPKNSEEISEERKKALEQKYINKIKKEYEQTLKMLSPENRTKKERLINETYASLESRFSTLSDFEYGERQRAVLKLKLARHFQTNESIDINTLYDAIIETSNFIETDKGSLHRLFEVHEQKTLGKIAEIRKKRAEMKGDETFNPYENLLTTKSGNYYIARLLNMPHLEQESDYMKHCVGTSDSYINKIKRGDIEILSFRQAPKVDLKTGKTTEETPIITIEYNLKTKEIEQMKKANDAYLSPNDPFFEDVIDALKQLKSTWTDAGNLRNFSKINSSELDNISVKDYYLLTEEGEIYFKDFDPEKNIFVLKIGKMEIDEHIPKEDASKIFHVVERTKVNPEEIAYNISEVSEKTKAYVGDWSVEIFQKIRNYPDIKHLYEFFPDKKIFKQILETDPKINSPKSAEEEMERKNIYLSGVDKDILYKTKFSKEAQKYELVRFTVGQLGFPNGATTQEIYDRADKLGLDLCPAEVGPNLRLQYDGKEWILIAMKQILYRDGDPCVFGLRWRDGQLELLAYSAEPAYRWDADRRFVFSFRKLKNLET